MFHRHDASEKGEQLRLQIHTASHGRQYSGVNKLFVLWLEKSRFERKQVLNDDFETMIAIRF
jgi:hypothetical protein